MIKRRGFLGKMAGLFGLVTLAVRFDVAANVAEPEPVETKKGIITKLPNGWVMSRYTADAIPGHRGQ